MKARVDCRWLHQHLLNKGVETTMDIVEGDQHDRLVATYQTLEIARLNDALKECGITDRELRRKVCESYFFSSGYFLDGCWFADEDGTRFRPGVYFAEIDEDDQLTGTLFLPDPSFGTVFHEYAHGATGWFFEDRNEQITDIEVGDAT